MNQDAYNKLDDLAKDAGKAAAELFKYGQMIKSLEEARKLVTEIKTELESINSTVINDLERHFADR